MQLPTLPIGKFTSKYVFWIKNCDKTVRTDVVIYETNVPIESIRKPECTLYRACIGISVLVHKNSNTFLTEIIIEYLFFFFT
jgi:hypothetical protein